MGMYATSANELKVEFNKDVSLTFKMHADLHMDLLRWLQAQYKRLELAGKRADKMESQAVELGVEENERFFEMTEQAGALRSKGGDTLDLMVEYVKKACNGWTDYYENAETEAAKQLLPFDATNIVRIGVIKLNKVITAFNEHYGLTEPESGEAKSESSPVLSQQKDRAVGKSPIGSSISAPTAP